MDSLLNNRNRRITKIFTFVNILALASPKAEPNQAGFLGDVTIYEIFSMPRERAPGPKPEIKHSAPPLDEMRIVPTDKKGKRFKAVKKEDLWLEKDVYEPTEEGPAPEPVGFTEEELTEINKELIAVPESAKQKIQEAREGVALTGRGVLERLQPGRKSRASSLDSIRRMFNQAAEAASGIKKRALSFAGERLGMVGKRTAELEKETDRATKEFKTAETELYEQNEIPVLDDEQGALVQGLTQLEEITEGELQAAK